VTQDSDVGGGRLDITAINILWVPYNRGICCQAEQLIVSEEELCCKKLVTIK
jgi:hypothetical protein